MVHRWDNSTFCVIISTITLIADNPQPHQLINKLTKPKIRLAVEI